MSLHPEAPGPDDAWRELADHAVPSPSPDFADRVLARLEADEDVAWSRLLAHHRVPPPSAGFVDRTFAALPPSRAAAAARPTANAPRLRTWRPWVLAAAAAAVGAGAAFWAGSWPPPNAGSSRPAQAAIWRSPQPVATVFGAAARTPAAPRQRSDFLHQVRFDTVDGSALLRPK